MLGWPGWTATFAGHSVPVGRDSAGLLTVQLPAQASGRLELSFEPPGLKVGVAAALLGLVGALALGWFGRRRRFDDDAEADAEADEAPEDEAPEGPATAHKAVEEKAVDPA